MNPYRFIIVLLFLFPATLIVAQNNHLITGYITDKETGKPIYNVNIKETRSNNGTTTNENGFFFIKTNKLPTVFEFSHVAYKTLKHECSISSTKINLTMEKLTDSLPEIKISAHRVVNLVERKFFDVVDYEFYNDNILLLAYSYKDNINPWLIMMNDKGDTLFRSPVKRDGNLYRDCLGNIHLITKDFAYQIFIENKQLQLLYPLNPDTFHKILDPCITEIHHNFFIKQWSLNNQVLSYSLVNSEDSSKKTVKVISDKKAIRMLADRNRFYSMGVSAPSEADIRFEEMCFFNPIFAPLLKLKEKVAIFNFVDSKIELFNENATPIKDVPIDFQKIKGWQEEIISDEITGKVYAIFKQNGLTNIREIDIETGIPGKIIDVPNFKYIQNMKARAGYLYFLYRINSPMELMKLYKMSI